jgi:TFIIF-interacting CTD phosphatase-like protein
MVDEKTSAKTMMLQGPNNKNKLKKTLLLDLDETLIHTSFVESEDFVHTLEIQEKIIWFNVRPHALEFLKNMAKIYEIVMFTAAEKAYAEAFFDYFNLRSDEAITSLLSR